MAGDRQVKVTIVGDASSLKRAFDDGASGAGKFAGAIGDVTKVAAGFIAANVIGEGVSRLGGFLSDSISAASDLGESLNAVNVVFKESSQKVISWGEQNANSFGLSQRAFNQMATPLGAMLKNAGLGMDEVADSTISLTERAADMASVFNTDVGDALTAIQAALRGESDPIERYGVSLSAAKVEARALADTGKSVASTLTDQEKAAARLALLFEQTNDLAGDFRNTSDSLANSQRIQAARTEELQAKIGTKLIPVVLKLNELKFALVGIIADKLLPAFDRLANFVGPVLGVAFEALSRFLEFGLVRSFEMWGRVIGRVTGVLGDFIGDVKWVLENGTGFSEKMVPGLGFLSEAIGKVAEATREVQHFFSLGFDGGAVGGELSTIGEASFIVGQRFGRLAEVVKSDVIPNVKDAQHYFALGFNGGEVGGELGTIQMAAFKVGQTFREDLMPAAQRMSEFVAEQVAKLVQHLDRHFARFPAYFNEEVKPALENVMRFVEFVVTGVVQFFQDHWTQIETIVQLTVDGIRMTIELLAGIITGTLDIIIKLLQGDWAGAWNATKDLVGLVWDGIVAIIKNRIELILEVLGLLKDIGVALIGGLLEGAASKLGELANWFFALPGKIVDQIPNPLSVLWSIGKQIMQGLLDGLKAGWDAVAGFVGSVAGKIADLKGPIEKDRTLLIPEGTAIMQGLGAGIRAGFNEHVAPLLQSMTAAGGTFSVNAQVAGAGVVAPVLSPLDQMKRERAGVFGAPAVYIDMRGAQFTGSPEENERMIERVVRRVLGGQGRESRLHGFN